MGQAITTVRGTNEFEQNKHVSMSSKMCHTSGANKSPANREYKISRFLFDLLQKPRQNPAAETQTEPECEGGNAIQISHCLQEQNSLLNPNPGPMPPSRGVSGGRTLSRMVFAR